MAKRYYVVASMPGGKAPMERNATGGVRGALKLGVKLARYFRDRAVIRERDTLNQSDTAVAVCYWQAATDRRGRRHVVACVPATGRAKLSSLTKRRKRKKGS